MPEIFCVPDIIILAYTVIKYCNTTIGCLTKLLEYLTVSDNVCKPIKTNKGHMQIVHIQHTYMHKEIHSYISHKHINIHQTNPCTCIHTLACACTYMYTHSDSQTCTHTNTLTRVYAPMHTHTHAHVHTQTHTHKHMYTLHSHLNVVNLSK